MRCWPPWRCGCWPAAAGDYVVPLPDVLRALAGEGERGALLVVRDLRLPRVRTGLLVVRPAQQAVVCFTGRLNGRGWEHVRPVALALLVLGPPALVLGRALTALRLGDDVARGRTTHQRWWQQWTPS